MADSDKPFAISAGGDHILVSLGAAKSCQIEELERLDTQLTKAIATNPSAQVRFDLRLVECISSGTLGWLAALNAKIRDDSGPVQLYNVRPTVEQVFHQIGIAQNLRIHPPGAEPGQAAAD